ncbi:GNAT family N-acetyltransferase [Phenylobacterium kunshanense]|uniref:N-acetyltransferase domain-containing protein n=1 Tax=Phenylobacterium kunshanense TaxID=1445034 RepID=A0A328BA26_9CAUL|nr:GNAT family N-acetyltransferase [Phenylobacterium kunshanense]RAK63311.1 hypothetical protein DJ019_16405 [Phenylobacterium kunshanense]
MTQILPATPDLMDEIEIWLDAEERAYNAGDAAVRGFRCNWDTVRKSWGCGERPVDVLVVGGKAVGFLYGTDILEIHPDHRGRSYGVLLSDFMVRRASDKGFSILEIEIAPATAEPFWVRQGFKPHRMPYRDGLYATLALERQFSLGQGQRVEVEIEFYDEKEARWGAPFARYAAMGERLPDGSIQLPERLHGHDPSLTSNTDNHIKIVVDGDELYFGRAKYGRDHGVATDPHGHLYIDRVIT